MEFAIWLLVFLVGVQVLVTYQVVRLLVAMLSLQTKYMEVKAAETAAKSARGLLHDMQTLNTMFKDMKQAAQKEKEGDRNG